MDWILSSHLDTLHNNVQQALPRLEQYSVCCVSCWFNDCISHRNCKLSWNTAVTNMYGFCTISNNNTFITFSADRSNAVPLLHLSLSLSLSLCLSVFLSLSVCRLLQPCSVFLLGSGMGCGLWLWHSLDFSLTFFAIVCSLYVLLSVPQELYVSCELCLSWATLLYLHKLKPVLGGVSSVANYITSHEQTQ